MRADEFSKEILLLIENVHSEWRDWNELSFHEFNDHHLCYIHPSDAYIEYRDGHWYLDTNQDYLATGDTLPNAELDLGRQMVRDFQHYESIIKTDNDIVWVVDGLDIIEAPLLYTLPDERHPVLYKDEHNEVRDVLATNTFLTKREAINRVLYRAERQVRMGQIHLLRLKDAHKEDINNE